MYPMLKFIIVAFVAYVGVFAFFKVSLCEYNIFNLEDTDWFCKSPVDVTNERLTNLENRVAELENENKKFS